MAHFEKISKYNEVDINLPVRSTANSAGYDFEVAEDTVIPPMGDMMNHVNSVIETMPEENRPSKELAYTLPDVKAFFKACGVRPTLVPTGVKCALDADEYLELSVRSSTPLNYWLILGNSIGIIDSDYYNNADNEGHIYFQLINLSPFNVMLRKGDKIGQGIIHKYVTTDNDIAEGVREGGFGSTNK